MISLVFSYFLSIPFDSINAMCLLPGTVECMIIQAFQGYTQSR